jgi:hypothetical protein
LCAVEKSVAPRQPNALYARELVRGSKKRFGSFVTLSLYKGLGPHQAGSRSNQIPVRHRITESMINARVRSTAIERGLLQSSLDHSEQQPRSLLPA